MRKLIWWLERCAACWDEEVELVDRDTLRFYEGEEEWSEMWAALETPILMDDEDGVFPGLSDYLVPI
jgi:hypothetical protein